MRPPAFAEARLAEIERLRLLIAGLQRNRFGRRFERLDDAAFQQGIENLKQSLAEQLARLDAASSAAVPAAFPGCGAGADQTSGFGKHRGFHVWHRSSCVAQADGSLPFPAAP
jgi:hypothetical protein